MTPTPEEIVEMLRHQAQRSLIPAVAARAMERGASLIEELQREIELTRSILAAGDVGSLPTFYPTHQMAADRMRELGEARGGVDGGKMTDPY